MTHRRSFFLSAAAASIASGSGLAQETTPQGAAIQFGLIGKMIAAPGKREALIAILLEGTGGMPGCLSYVVAKDVKDENGIWITEVWDSDASHKASLKLPAVQKAIAAGRPMIAGFESSVTTEPVGGFGLPARK